MTDRPTFGIIPARGGSKGVPRKNIRPLGGEPLIHYTIRAAEASASVDRYLVSTDDEEIRETARDCGAPAPFLRPAELAADETPMEPVIEHAIEFAGDDWDECAAPGTLVLLQPTSPLRDADHVDAALELFDESGADSLVSTYEDHSYRWGREDGDAARKNYAGDRKRRQDKTPEYVENGAIYVTDVDRFVETKDLQTGTTELYVMDERRSVDIDSEFDFWLAERILTEWEA